ERTVRGLGQRRVGVAGEVFEGAARQLDEAEVAPAAAQVAKPGLADLQLNGAVVVFERTQQLRAVHGKRDLPQQEPQPLHLRIGRKEAAAEERGKAFVTGARVFQRCGI